MEGRLVEPMRAVRAREAEVVLPYRACRVDWDMGEEGVRLRRPGGVVDGEEDAP